MADHTIGSGEYGSPLFALTADEVSTVTFADDLDTVEVYSDGTAEVWWTADGTAPSSTGHGYLIPTMGIDVRGVPTSGGTVVKLWSSGNPTVRVCRT